MARKWMMLGLGLVLALGMVGCASVDTGTKFNDMNLTTSGQKPVAHLNGSCWGIYLFPVIPLLTGDTASVGSIAVGQDTATVEPVVEMTTRKAKQLGATSVVDLQSHKTSLYIPPVFWYKSCEVSGNAVK